MSDCGPGLRYNYEPRREPELKRIFMHLDYVISKNLCKQFYRSGTSIPIPMPKNIIELDELREIETEEIRARFNDPNYNPLNTDRGGVPWGYIFRISAGKFSTGLGYLDTRDEWQEIRINNDGEWRYDHNSYLY